MLAPLQRAFTQSMMIDVLWARSKMVILYVCFNCTYSFQRLCRTNVKVLRTYIIELSEAKHPCLRIKAAGDNHSPPHYCLDLELCIVKPIPGLGGSIVFLHPPKKSSGPNSVGENYFWPRPFPYMGKILTFDRKVVEILFWYQNDRN